MPLLSGKKHVFAEPPENMKIGDSMFVISLTGEIFNSKKNYEEQQKLYSDTLWTCRCSGRANLTYQQALKSEADVRSLLKSQVTPPCADVILGLVNQSTDNLESLINKCHQKLSSSFQIGDRVFIKPKSGDNKVGGTIMKVRLGTDVSSNDKENSVSANSPTKTSTLITESSPASYDVYTDERLSVMSVKSANLTRSFRIPSKETIRLFIKSNSTRHMDVYGHPWIIDRDAISLVKQNDASHVSVQSINKRKSDNVGMNTTPSKKRKSSLQVTVTPLTDFLTNTKEYSSASSKPDIVDLYSPKKSTSDGSSNKNKKAQRKVATSASKASAKKSELKKSFSNRPVKKLNGSSAKKELKNEAKSSSSKDETANPKKKMKQMTLFDMSPEAPSKSPQKKVDRCLDKSIEKSPQKKSSKSPQKKGEKLPKKKMPTPSKKIEKSTKKQKSTKKGDALPKNDNSVAKSLQKKNMKSKVKTPSPNKVSENKRLKKNDKSTSGKSVKSLASAKKIKEDSKASSAKVKASSAKAKNSPVLVAKNSIKKVLIKSLLPAKSTKGSIKIVSAPKSGSPSKEMMAMFFNTNIQEFKFKQAMKKLLDRKANATKPMYYRSIVRKTIQSLSLEYQDLVPLSILPEYIETLDRLISREVIKLADVPEKQRNEYLERKRVEEIEKNNKNIMVDDKLLTLTPLPEANIIGTPDGLPNEMFGDVVMITEFLNCYQGLLLTGTESRINTRSLMEALVSGRNSFDFLSKVLLFLLQTLLQDQIAEDYTELGFKLNEVPVNQFCAAELVRLTLRSNDDIVDDDSQEHDKNRLKSDEVSEELIAELEMTEFYELDAVSKLKIIGGLCHRMMSSYSVQKHHNDIHKKCSELINKKRSEIKEENIKLKKQQSKTNTERAANSLADDVVQIANGDDEKNTDSSQLLLSDFFGKKVEAAKESVAVETVEKVDEDLASVVKNRRLMVKKANEEKEKQDELKKKHMEELRKQAEKEKLDYDCQKALEKWKHHFRLLPLGYDRNHDRYWIFKSSNPVLCFEKGWIKDLDYRMEAKNESSDSVSDDDGDESVQEDDDIKPVIKDTPADDDNSTLPSMGQNLWFGYESSESVDELIKCLGSGIREQNLKSNLSKCLDKIKPVATKRRPGLEFTPVDYQEAMTSALQSELINFASEIMKGGMGTIKKYDVWCKRVENAKTVRVLAKFIVELKNSILPRFLGKIFRLKNRPSNNNNNEVRQVVQKWALLWEDAVANSQTLSRLHVLIGILDGSVKWDESPANVKCKICRRKKFELEMVLCKKCKNGYHLQCLRPVLQALPETDWLCSICKPHQDLGYQAQRRTYAEYKSEQSCSSSNGDDYNCKSSEAVVRCIVCDGDGEVVECSRCDSAFHFECHQPPPPLRHSSRGLWACSQCVTGTKVKGLAKKVKKRNVHKRVAAATKKSRRNHPSSLRNRPTRRSKRHF